MNSNRSIWKGITVILLVSLVAASISVAMPSTVEAASGSLYVIADIAANPTPVQAYDVQGSTLVYQTTFDVPNYAGGGVGVDIDTDSGFLFVTYENSNTIQLVNAETMTGEGTITAPGASNLAGIVVDEGKQKVYTMDRDTDNLYIYSWDASAQTLTLDNQLDLTGVSAAHGLALDEIRGLLFVGEMVSTDNIDVFSTDDWSWVASYTVSESVQGIAVDAINRYVYTGNAGWFGHTLCKYDLNSGTETSVAMPTLTGCADDGAVGLAVDPNTGLLYVTTGNQGSEGRVLDDSDQILVLDSNLNLLYQTGDIGNPTGICVPGETIAYNPLGLSKDAGLAEGQCISPGEDITYEICYDNTKNDFDVHNVNIVDELPAEVSFVSATGGGTYDPSTHTVAWDIGTLSAGEVQQCLQLTAHVGSTVSPGIKPVSAWIPTWGEPVLDESLAMFKENTDLFEAVSPYAYRFDGTTTLETMYPYQEDSTLLKTIRDEGVKVIPTLRDDYGINPGPYLADPEFRETYISTIVSKVEAMGYDGIDIDFETMAKEDRHAFSNFMSELSASLQARGKLLTTAVMTKTVDFPGWGPVDAMDWALLGGVCDKVIIMFYNGEPASTDYVKNVIDYAISVMPKNRIVYAARFDPPGYMSASLLEEQLDIILTKGIRREIYLWGLWGDDSSLWAVAREKLATAPAPTPSSTIVNCVTIDSNNTPPTTIAESTDVCPLPDQIALEVEVAPKPPADGKYYKVGEDIEFDVTIHNPTDFDAYQVKLTAVEPPEIDIEDGWFATPWPGKPSEHIPAGETRSTIFEAEAVENGENIEVIVNAVGYTDVTGEAGKLRGTGVCSINIHPEEGPDWSFAVITDLHIGYNSKPWDSDDDEYEEIDYAGKGWDWDDGEPLQEDSYDEVTKRSKCAVETIIAEKDYYNIKFVMVLGDISDTAELSEFLTARDILNELNVAGIPYIPIFGNHDTWPYAQDKDNERDRYSSIAGCAIGDQLFKEVFWGEANNDNKVLIDNLFGDSWDHMYNEPVPLNAGALECGCYDFTLQTDDGKYFEKDEKECNSETTDYYLQNYGFTYNGITFICLDQVPRLGEDREPWNGNALPGAFIKGLFATDHEQTVDFSRKHYEAYPSETAVLFSHYPTHPESIDNYLLTPRQRWLSSSDSPEYAYWFAGHVHYHKDSLGVKRRVIETEDVAGIPFYLLGVPVETIMLGERNGKTIRIVQIDDGELDYSTVLKPMREVAIKWPRPLLEIIWPFKSLPEPGTEITFTARCASYYGFSTSFDWNFGDGNTSSSLWPSVTHGYSVEGDYDVTVTVTTKNLTTGEETTHSTTRTVCVRNKHIISPLPVSVRATSFFTGQDLSQVPKNTYEPVLISKEASEETLIAGLGVHFEEADEDIDLSNLVADVDLEEGKSVIYMPSWPEEVEEYKNFYIPSKGVGTVYICLDATSLGEVTSENADVIINVGETKENITVTTHFYNGREYYLVSSVTGTGGGEFASQLPIADAGPDQMVYVIPPSITAAVTLDGSGSYDPDGDPLTYNWTWDSNTASGVSPIVELPLGTTTITLVVNNGQVDSEPDTVDITVGAIPPTMRCTPKFFFFAAREAGENPQSRTLTIYNFGAEGCAPLEWTVSDGAEWLTLSPTSGTTMRTIPGDQADVSVNISDMSAGTYLTWITIEAPGATNTPQQVPVFLTVMQRVAFFPYTTASASVSHCYAESPFLPFPW